MNNNTTNWNKNYVFSTKEFAPYIINLNNIYDFEKIKYCDSVYIIGYPQFWHPEKDTFF